MKLWYNDVTEYPKTYAADGVILPELSVERNGSEVKVRPLNYKNPGSNPELRFKNLGQVFSLYIVPVYSAVYMSIWL